MSILSGWHRTDAHAAQRVAGKWGRVGPQRGWTVLRSGRV